MEYVVRNCSAYLKYQRTHAKENLLLRQIPPGPWEAIGVSISSQNHLCILIVDYYSKLVRFKN